METFFVPFSRPRFNHFCLLDSPGGTSKITERSMRSFPVADSVVQTPCPSSACIFSPMIEFKINPPFHSFNALSFIYSLFHNVAKIFHIYDKIASSSASPDSTSPDVIGDDIKKVSMRRHQSSSIHTPAPTTRRSNADCQHGDRGRLGKTLGDR